MSEFQRSIEVRVEEPYSVIPRDPLEEPMEHLNSLATIDGPQLRQGDWSW